MDLDFIGIAVDKAYHGDFTLLLGEKEDDFWDFVIEKADDPLNEGVVISIPFRYEERSDDWKAWMAFRYTNEAIITEGVFIPSEDEYAMVKPEGYEDWPEFEA